jgi:hypothetical protein
MAPRARWLAPFLLWTLFVWGGRIRNAVADDAGATAAIVLSLTFVVPALVVAVAWVLETRRAGSSSRVATVRRTVGQGLAAWTIAVWLVRGVDIALLGDHDIAFVVVHLMLALVSILLAAAVLVVTWLRHPRRGETVAVG